ncbi:hypothetical protein H4W31_006334 [Plantactinospora soyae]|uniref:Uncharacterized protein n=1 Tax=Plantactinospora soyae TaxID=1544732 RepID=A0A927RAF2_9ACTN|nr:hypothetical protein [Plantactinospora soyae]
MGRTLDGASASAPGVAAPEPTTIPRYLASHRGRSRRVSVSRAYGRDLPVEEAADLLYGSLSPEL